MARGKWWVIYKLLRSLYLSLKSILCVNVSALHFISSYKGGAVVRNGSRQAPHSSLGFLTRAHGLHGCRLQVGQRGILAHV